MTSSRSRQMEELEKIIERFLEELEETIQSHDRPKYSAEEREREMKEIEPLLGALAQRWSLTIIYVLYMRSLNFNELKELLPGISSRTLTDKLRTLERSGILTRSVSTDAPVRVGYSLTTQGREIALSSLALLYQLRKQKRLLHGPRG